MASDEPLSPAPKLKGRNIVIFCDGTGQRGGVYFDEARTNIYKLYRATRVAPDSAVSADLQLAFYDPGLGTQSTDGPAVRRAWRWLYNLISQATGLGITQNIIDCYAALIQMWQPGDRIFLFGFSRGAYTARCLSSVICMCGIPTTAAFGKPLKRDTISVHTIARWAVKKVYQHVGSPKDTPHLNQRELLAKQFRELHNSGASDQANAYPFFIGVFDTVAALSNIFSLVAIVAGSFALLAGASYGLSFISHNFNFWAARLFIVTVAMVSISYIFTHLKFAFGLPGISVFNTIHLNAFRQRFYDLSLNPNVKYARHAIAIDEHRADFARVPWGARGVQESQQKIWTFEQIWFAGNHADIGGGYPENESRLSDTALKWMVAAAEGLTDESLIVDHSVLNSHPAASGMQHDETKTGVFRFGQQKIREIPNHATVHHSVEERFALPAVQQYDLMLPYRPEGLRNDDRFTHYYSGSRK